jgi:hypothetical protein|tara:strand:- start:63 stop:443 length:381 start_codon:yes stop_codon:yes gene_type:complete
MAIKTVTDIVWEGTTPKLMARVVGAAATNITQASVDSISKIVVLNRDGSTVVAADDITVSEVVYNTLQTDATWTKDETGYNFAHALAITDIPDGDDVYVIQYQLTDTASKVSVVEFVLTTKENYQS